MPVAKRTGPMPVAKSLGPMPVAKGTQEDDSLIRDRPYQIGRGQTNKRTTDKGAQDARTDGCTVTGKSDLRRPGPLSTAVRNSPSGVGGAVGLVLEGLARV